MKHKYLIYSFKKIITTPIQGRHFKTEQSQQIEILDVDIKARNKEVKN